MTVTFTAESRLFRYLRAQLERKLRESNLPIQVWLDVDGLYTDFVCRLAESDFFADVLTFSGSYIEMLLRLDDHLDGLDPRPLLLHLPGHTPDSIRETPLLEAYLCGKVYQKNLITLAKEAAAGQVAPERISPKTATLKLFEEAEQWLEQAFSRQDPLESIELPVDDFLYRLLSAPSTPLGQSLDTQGL